MSKSSAALIELTSDQLELVVGGKDGGGMGSGAGGGAAGAGAGRGGDRPSRDDGRGGVKGGADRFTKCMVENAMDPWSRSGLLSCAMEGAFGGAQQKSGNSGKGGGGNR